MESKPGGLLYLSWGAVAGRADEITAELKGEAVDLFPRLEYHRPPAPVRYLLAGCWTIALLAHRRPQSLIVTNPPVFPGVLALAYGRLSGAAVVLDDHPGSFGAMGDQNAARLLPIHRRMVRAARLCLVTSEHWVQQVEAWGGRALVFHEAPGTWNFRPKTGERSLTQLLYASTYARDEPIKEVFEAARLLPDLRILITGDPTHLPPSLRNQVPPNVQLIGLLPFRAYQRVVYTSDAVMALTTEPTSAMRAAFEAVWAGRPLVVSNWPLLAELFPEAVRVTHDPTEIANGIRALQKSYRDRIHLAQPAEARQRRSWADQLDALRAALQPLHEKPLRK
jgi:glycosyltransferase involved in cell wall biosynthesis